MRFYEEMLAEGDVPWGRWLDEVEEVRAKLARLIGARRDEIAFTYSSSHGMNLVAQLVRVSGVVLTMADEFPSSSLPWLQQGRRVQFVPSREHGVIPIVDIARRVTPETRIVVTSWVQYATGFRQDLTELGRLCRDHGLLLVVDASQAMGILPIDVRTSGIDALVFSGYKWTMAGYGVAGLFVAKHLLDPTHFPVAGWFGAREPMRLLNDRVEAKDSAAGLEVGCPHFAGIFALGAALALLDSLGTADIAARIHALTEHLLAKLTSAGLEVASPAHRTQRAGITVVAVDRPAEIAEQLARRGILVATRGRGLRISVHVFNTFEDIDRCVDALCEVLRTRG